jgi:hypothetical protein
MRTAAHGWAVFDAQTPILTYGYSFGVDRARRKALMNLGELPRNPIAKLMFRLSGSAPGLRFNNIAPLFMEADKAALRRWVADEFRTAPPRWLIATHGDVVDLAANPDAGRRLFGSI